MYILLESIKQLKAEIQIKFWSDRYRFAESWLTVLEGMLQKFVKASECRSLCIENIDNLDYDRVKVG